MKRARQIVWKRVSGRIHLPTIISYITHLFSPSAKLPFPRDIDRSLHSLPFPLLYTLYSVKTAAFTSMTYDWEKILPEILYHPCDLLKREREREGEIYIYRFVQIFSEKKFDIIEEKCAIFNLMISFIRKIVSNFQHSFVILVNFKGIVSLLLYTRVYLIHFSISFENIF